MSKNNIHSAAGSALGFLFQIERVLLWLSEGKENGIVGIETDDDIVVKLQNDEDIKNIYEQAKNAQRAKIPFSDQSEDLWKTLSIWATAIQNNRININSATFSAITNKKLPSNRLLVKIGLVTKSDGEGMSSCIQKLRSIGKKISPNSSIKQYVDNVLGIPDELLKDLMHNIIVLDGSFHHNQNDLKRKLKSNLKISNNLPFDFIYEGLYGYISSYIIDCWRNGLEAWIEVESFNKRLNDLIAEHSKKTFIEKATSYLPVTRKDVENNKGKTYVEQLNCITCNERETLDAIHDYLRALTEKSRYAKEGDVPEQKYQQYYDDLKSHWETIHKPKCKVNPNRLKLHLLGYEIYYDVIKYKGKLNNQEPEQTYTYRGAYHYLSNNLDIGWHPEWEKLFKKNSNGEPK